MDEQEFERMKQNAQKAAQAYQAKSRPSDASPAPPDKQQPAPPAPAPAPDKDKREGLLTALMKDRDKTMILALILLLMDEGGDYDLLLALLYLLM